MLLRQWPCFETASTALQRRCASWNCQVILKRLPTVSPNSRSRSATLGHALPVVVEDGAHERGVAVRIVVVLRLGDEAVLRSQEARDTRNDTRGIRAPRGEDVGTARWTSGRLRDASPAWDPRERFAVEQRRSRAAAAMGLGRL